MQHENSPQPMMLTLMVRGYLSDEPFVMAGIFCMEETARAVLSTFPVILYTDAVLIYSPSMREAEQSQA